MARINLAGFEIAASTTQTREDPDGVFAVSNCTGVLDTAVKRTGKSSAKFTTTTAAGLGRAELYALSGASRAYLRAYFRVNLPTSECTLAQARDGSGAILAEARLATDGSLRLYVNTGGSTTQQGSDSAEKFDDDVSWFNVELFVHTPAAGSDVATLRLNGVEVATWSGTFTGTAVMTSFLVGYITTPGANGDICRVDDVAIDDADWVGESQISLALPVANPQNGSWTGGAGGSSNLYEAVNNTPPTGTASETDATQIESVDASGNNATDEYRGACYPYLALGAFDTAQLSGGGGDAIGQATTATEGAQSFQASGAVNIAGLMVEIQKIGSPADLVIALCANNAGVPGTVLDSVTIPAADITTTLAWRAVKFATPVALSAATTYWIKLSFLTGAPDGANYYQVGRDSSSVYANGSWWRLNEFAGDIWQDRSLDAKFALLLDDGPEPGATYLEVSPMVWHGEDVNTNTKTGSFGPQDNPAIASGGWSPFTFGSDVGALGTWPTNWRSVRSFGYSLSGLVETNGLMLGLRKTDAGTRVASVCFLGAYVEWLNPDPPAPATRPTPVVTGAHMLAHAPSPMPYGGP